MGEKADQDRRGCAKTINQFGKTGSWSLGLLASGEATSFPLSTNSWCLPGCQGVRQSPYLSLTLLYRKTPRMAVIMPRTLVLVTGFRSMIRDTVMTMILLVALATE